MADVSTSEILISDLPTKSVTFTPLRATVTREIKATIQPGQNEVTVLGLDPNVDVDSIRIEGTGPATITDIQTEIVPRREQFSDVFPEESDEDESESDEEHSENEVDPKLKDVREEVIALEARLAKANNEKMTSVSTLEFLDNYGKGMKSETTDLKTVEEFLGVYARQRAEEGEKHRAAEVKVVDLQKELKKAVSRRQKLEARHQRAKEAALKEERRVRQKRQREREQQREQRDRKRNERMSFWTYDVGQVVVHLDSQSVMTPGSSRRSSVVETIEKPGPVEAVEVTLSLSYVVPRANWTSRYELSINTPSSSARMAYRAEFYNGSAETWRDARITLSNSQASFSGLGERIPSMNPWHILVDSSTNRDGKDQPSWDRILRSVTEGGATASNANDLKLYEQQLRLMEAQGKPRYMMARKDPVEQSQSAPQAQSGALFGSRSLAPQPTASLFGSAAPAAVSAVQQMSISGAPMPPPDSSMSKKKKRGLEDSDAIDEEEEDEAEEYSGELLGSNVEYQDSIKQDYGLTTTYNLPGRRTLAPSLVNRRHVLADLDLKTMTLSHIIVPKHRVAAFLRARVKNTSSVKMLRGRVGMTVDGTFLGTTNMPNCAPNDFFNLSLGVDPSIQVTYAKPTVRRATGGFFAKEEAAIFRRTCWVKNSKSTAADITVIDQVPVSEDDKLRVHIIEPAGLSVEGARARMDMPQGKGKGEAIMGKTGEVRWVIRLEAGKDVRMVLEYEARVPSGSEVDTSYGQRC